jgi:RimJ/RimL family protein N-acetyltransferase
VKVSIEAAMPDLLALRSSWRYPPPYDLYDDDGVLPENPERFYGVRDEHRGVVGFFYFERRGDAIFYGLELRPDLTGRGLGLEFVRGGLDFASDRFGMRRLVLDVAEFTERAIKVYERAAFRRTGSHTRFFERWGEVPFVEMERLA